MSQLKGEVAAAHKDWNVALKTNKTLVSERDQLKGDLDKCRGDLDSLKRKVEERYFS